MLDLDDHLARLGLRIGERLQHVVDRAAGNALLVEDGEPVRGRLGAEARGELRFELRQMRHAVGVVAEARILGELGAPIASSVRSQFL